MNEAGDIDREVFTRIVKLAAIELTEEQAIYFLNQLNIQLTAIREMDQIEEINAHTPITTHGVSLDSTIRQQLRADIVRESKYADSILMQMPETFERYIVVPAPSNSKI